MAQVSSSTEAAQAPSSAAPQQGPATTETVSASTQAPAPATSFADDDLLTPTSSLQLLASLALVLAVIVTLGWLSRRLQRLQPRRGRSLQMLDVLPVGARERVALVQVGSTQLVLGLAPGRVQTLHVLNADRVAQTIPADERDEDVSPLKPFASLLKR